MTGLALPLLQIPSFNQYEAMLESGDRTVADNFRRLFGINKPLKRVQLSRLLNSISPEMLQKLGVELYSFLRHSSLFKKFQTPYGVPVAIDGTGHTTFRESHCRECRTIHHRTGVITYQHSVNIAAVIQADGSTVVPLLVEPIINQDGEEKQDCEYKSFKRMFPKLCEISGKKLILADGLYALQGVCRAIVEAGYNYIITIKPDNHKTSFEYFVEAETTTAYGNGIISRYRFMNAVPLTVQKDSALTNMVEVAETQKSGKHGYHNTFCTNIELNKGNCAELCRLGRLRWGIENSTNNVLKNGGYEFKHAYTHGDQHGCTVMAMLSIIALTINILSALFRKSKPLRKSVKELIGDARTLLQYRKFATLEELSLLLAGA